MAQDSSNISCPAEAWKAEYVKEFESIGLARDFPCTFLRPAYQAGHIKFHFMGDPGDEAQRRAGYAAIRDYVQDVLATEDDGTAALKILLVVVNADAISGPHEDAAWSLLNDFAAMDPVPWPSEVPTDPNSESWAYCISGARLFVNISSPEHVKRRSRNLGRHLVLVVQLRDGVDFIAPPNEDGDAVRRSMRRRVAAYDTVPVSPDLATHGQGTNRDWKQFWLGDRTTTHEGQCPFNRHTVEREKGVDVEREKGVKS